MNSKIPGTIIYSVLVGSRGYGTNTPESDFDYKHIYVQDIYSLAIEGLIPMVVINKDEVAYEITKFKDLLLKSDPNAIEMLFADKKNRLFCHESFKYILKKRSSFISKKIKHTFGGFANSQIKKARGLNKKMNWDKAKVTRKELIDFCTFNLGHGKTMPLKKYLINKGLVQQNIGLTKLSNIPGGYAMFYDDLFRGIQKENSNELRLSSVPKEKVDSYIGDMFYNQNAYMQHCKDYKDYKVWMENRNTQRYVDVNNHGQQIDGKNMLHCVRLLEMTKEVLSGKRLTIKRKNADFLLSIRRGEHDLNDILKYCETLMQDIEELYKITKLPEDIDENFLLNQFKNIKLDFITDYE